MITCDSNEPVSIQMWISQSVPTDRELLNRPAILPRPDYVWIDWAGRIVGVSRKQGGEFAGGIDATEAQLLDEMGGVDHMALLIEGWVTPAADGGCQTWIQRESKTGTAYYKGKALGSSYKAMQGKLASFRAAGIDVIWTAGEYETAVCLVELYQWSQKTGEEHATFRRLIKEKYVLSVEDEQKRGMALLLMSIKGVGEEAALAIAEDFDSLAKLWPWLQDAEHMKYVAALPLRSGKRSVGPAVVSRLRKGFGIA